MPVVEHDRYEYWRRLSAPWRTGATIVNVEHDMEWSATLEAELLECPQALCTHAYRMHIPRAHWAHGWQSPVPSFRGAGAGISWCGDGEAWADYSAIGFCKIAPEARVAELARAEWPGVELAVNRAVRGLWHVHWPAVEHYHKEPRAAIT